MDVSHRPASVALVVDETTPTPTSGDDATLFSPVTPTTSSAQRADAVVVDGVVVVDGAAAEAADAVEAVGRRALPALALVYLLVFASSGIQLPLTSVAMTNVGLSPSTIGAMWGARSLASAIAPFLWGLAADRLGKARPLLAVSLFLGCALTWALSTTTTPWVCVLLFGIYGATTGPAGSMIDGMTLTALGRRRASFGRWRGVGTIAFGVSSVVVIVLMQEHLLQPVPRALFPLCAGFLAIAAVVVVALVPSLPRPALTDPRLVVVAFRQPLLVGLVVLGLVLWSSHGGWAGFLAVLVQNAGMSDGVTAAAIAFSVVTEAVVMASVPWVIARLGVPRILVACAALACLRWALVSTSLSPPLFVLVHGLHGVTFGLFFVVIVGVIAERCPPELRQASQGLLASLVFGVGGFFGSSLAGAVLEHTSSAASVWRAMAVVAAVATAISIVVAYRLATSPPATTTTLATKKTTTTTTTKEPAT